MFFFHNNILFLAKKRLRMCSVSVLMTLMVEETYAMELIRVIQHTPVAERMFFQYTPFRTVRNIHVYQMLKERLYLQFLKTWP